MMDYINLISSSRVRLARNVADMPYPSVIDINAGRELTKKLAKQLNDFKFFYLSDMDSTLLEGFVERHLISPSLIDHRAFSGFCINKNGTVSVMLNEEDHIRTQAILPNFNIRGAYELADSTDDILSERIKFSFDEQLGFLTACPTNLGTGMRASAMIFMPALTMTGNLRQINNFLDGKDLLLRGFYGENTEIDGYMYQISNRFSLGVSEKEIINNVSDNIKIIADKELQTLERMFNSRRTEMTDKIMRAYGILSNCYTLTSKELSNLLVYIKIGALLSMFSLANLNELDNLMVMSRKGNLITASGISDVETRDIARAELTRNTIKKLVG